MKKVERSPLDRIGICRLNYCLIVKRRQDTLEWFSPLNFFKTQQDVFSRREEGTGEWFIESPVFQDWLSGTVRTLCSPGIRKWLCSKELLVKVI